MSHYGEHDLPRCDRMYDALPPDDEGQCPCDADLGRSNGPFECSACGEAICEDCALAGECRNDACENVYCLVCAKGFLRARDAGVCVPCVNRIATVPVAFFGEERRSA